MLKNYIILFLILLTSLTVFCQDGTLTAVDVTEGKYAGYKALKGYEGEELFQVYFQDHSKGNITSYTVVHENLKNFDMDEIFTFEYRGERRQSTRLQLYNLFNSASKFKDFKALDDREFSQIWFSKTFGQVYQDWFDDLGFSHEAGRLVEQYYRQSEPLSNRFDTSEIIIK